MSLLWRGSGFFHRFSRRLTPDVDLSVRGLSFSVTIPELGEYAKVEYNIWYVRKLIQCPPVAL